MLRQWGTVLHRNKAGCVHDKVTLSCTTGLGAHDKSTLLRQRFSIATDFVQSKKNKKNPPGIWGVTCRSSINNTKREANYVEKKI